MESISLSLSRSFERSSPSRLKVIAPCIVAMLIAAASAMVSAQSVDDSRSDEDKARARYLERVGGNQEPKPRASQSPETAVIVVSPPKLSESAKTKQNPSIKPGSQ